MKVDNLRQAEDNVTEKILNLQLLNNITKANLYIEHLHTRIKFYENQIQILREEKPFKFRKKALKKYYEQINEYEEKIKLNYKEIEKEFKFIAQIYENLNQ